MKVTLDLTAMLEQGKITQDKLDRLRALANGVWATRAGRRWAINGAAVLGAIHFYTQRFDKLGPPALSFLPGGLVMLAFALALWTFNRCWEALPA